MPINDLKNDQEILNIIDHEYDENFWMEYRTGNILNEFDLDFIIHQANCFHCMGGGVAWALAKTWPEIIQADKNTPYGDKNKMGTYSIASVTRPIAHDGEVFERVVKIVNIYSQFKPGQAECTSDITNSKLALETALISLRDYILKSKNTCIIKNRKWYVGVPWMIGCGIYGMAVPEIFQIFKQVFYDYSNNIKIIFVDYNGN